MPFKAGYSQGTISANIAECTRAGNRPRQSCIAGAYRKARADFRKANPGKSLPEYLRTKKKKDGYCRVVDRKMRSYGDIDDEKRKIRVNPRKRGLLNTILHEEIHRKHRSWKEKRVKKVATKQESALTIPKAIGLLERFRAMSEKRK